MLDLLVTGRVLGPRGWIERGAVGVRGGRVAFCGPAARSAALAAARTVDHADGVVAPGFVDLHVHGAAGADAADGTEAGLRRICRVHARHGTVALCPTVLTSPVETMLRALDTVRALTGRAPGGGARVLGAHLEGPFLDPSRAGAQPREHVCRPDLGLLEQLLAAASGALRIVTLAPELPGALALVERLRADGVVVAMGHSSATFAEARRAVDAGCTVATHGFNAMSPLHHREPGLMGAALLDDRVVTEVIADGIHVHPAMLRLVARCARRGARAPQMALVTDCTAALEAGAGGARLGDQPVSVRDGAVRLADGTLAGSSLTMARAVQTLAGLGELRRSAVLDSASAVPARVVLGRRDAGRIAIGARADLVLLDQRLRLVRTFIEGRQPR